MLLGLFKAQPLLDSESTAWMLDVYAWALRNFDAQVFFQATPLVTPTNEHFPGQGGGAHEMAGLIFERVTQYAGMGHWPIRIMDSEQWSEQAAPAFSLEGPLRTQSIADQPAIPDTQKLVALYSPEQLRDPEVVIANFAHTLAHYLGGMAKEAPPGGVENWPHVTELLAVFLGFGVMMANTAFTTKIRSCSSCASPAVERTNFLSQYDITYALAIFAVVKDIPRAEVLLHLKSTLRPFYKKAHKEVTANAEAIRLLQGIAQ
jgi:hypothetical protein